MSHIAVTGATGHVGGRIARNLAAADVPIRLLVRDPHRAPHLPGVDVVPATYGHTAACAAALRDVDTVFMVPIIDGSDRRREHHDFIDAVVRAGVRQVVYLSFVGADEDPTGVFIRHHGETESYLAATGVDLTLVRSNYYAESLELFLRDDELRAPVGDGRVAAVARDDVADAIAAILTDPAAHERAIYELTGPEALGFADIADLFTRLTGRPHRFVDESDEQAVRSRLEYCAPEDVLDAWLSMYRAIGSGVHSHVTDHVRTLTGRPPTSVLEALSLHASSIEA
jgi:uncharacterized protein YbjT (DUF2867 family)